MYRVIFKLQFTHYASNLYVNIEDIPICLNDIVVRMSKSAREFALLNIMIYQTINQRRSSLIGKRAIKYSVLI